MFRNLMAVLALTLVVAACSNGKEPLNAGNNELTRPPACVENDPGCSTVTVPLPDYMQEDWQAENRQYQQAAAIGLAPATPTPPDVYVCGTVEDVNGQPGSDCVLHTADVGPGNILQVTYTLRVGYVYTIAYYYAGQFRVDNMTVDAGAGAVPITGFIFRGGLATGDPGSYCGGEGLWGRGYGCFYVDRHNDGTVEAASFNQAPCDAQIYDYVEICATDSDLTVTSATDVELVTSFEFDVTGATNVNAGGSQPSQQMSWDAGRSAHCYQLNSVFVGQEHLLRATTPQTNPTTGFRVNLDTLTLAEVSLNSVVSTPNEVYHHYVTTYTAPAAPDLYNACSAGLNGSVPHIDQLGDNRTITVNAP